MSRTLVAAFALFLAACGVTKTSRVLTGGIAPPFVGEVRVIMEGQPLPESFREVAIVQARRGGPTPTSPMSSPDFARKQL